MLEPSGAQWCARYPTSTSLVDLAEPFRTSVSNFISALRTANGSVQVNATYRPQERAYLMHWCCMIADSGQDPAAVPPLAGVAIDWTHGGDHAGAKAGAAAMKQGYNIAFPAALVSRHTQRRAIDMTIRFAGAIQVKNKSGLVCMVAAQADLNPIGATYGVHKLLTDPPHWSDDGH
jgi:hypothetical protein